MLIQSVNTELNEVRKWMIANKLTINVSKTKYLILHRKKNIPNNLEPIRIGNSILIEEQSIKFLGVVVDNRLTWNSHIQYINSKINKQCGILYLTRKCFNAGALRQLYYSLIYPFLSYCHTIWGNTGKTNTKRIEIAQKRVIRTMAFKGKFDHTNELFRTFKLLKFQDVNTFCSSIFVYKSMHGFNNLRLFNVHLNERYDLRNVNDLVIPLMSSKPSQTSIAYHGAKIWNSIPINIQNKPSLASFKINLKSYLLNRY